MRVGIDCDGVLANFNQSFIPLIRKVLGGKDLFPEGAEYDPNFPDRWNYPQFYGYTNEEVHTVWERVWTSQAFWLCLEPLPGMEDLARNVRALEYHDIYFITDRRGEEAKFQTEWWLTENGWDITPTVLLSGHKGSLCAALNLDCYLDDKLENIEGVKLLSPSTRAYLLAAPYNATVRDQFARVVYSVQEFLDKESLV